MRNYLFILPLLFGLIGCNNGTLNSQKPTSEVEIDGMLYKWENALINPTNEPFGIGVMNDDSNIYIALSTFDQETKMKVLKGLTVWINSEGKKKETFGIKYPVQMSLTGMCGMMQFGGDPNQISHDRERDPNTMIQQILSQQEDLILTDKGIDHFAPIDNGEDGIQVKMEHNQGNLVYELKVPLNILKVSKNKIWIGIETAELEKPDMKGQESGGKGGGISGGGRQGGGMSGGGRPSGEMLLGHGQELSPLKYWIKVVLDTE